MADQLTRCEIETLPNYRRKTRREWTAACPFCGSLPGGAHRDGFIYWPDDGNWYCRKCGEKGFVADSPTSWSPEDRKAFMDGVAARAERERLARRAALDAMEQRGDRVALYHHQMQDRSYWYSQGLSDATIDAYQLGWCARCPTCQQCASWTIPVMFRGKLLNIRHRLIKPHDPHDKYRPETAGIGNMIFNGDLFDQAESNPVILVVEGEVKAMALTQRGFPSIGVPGASSFKESWSHWFAGFAEVLVAFDPGAERQARKAATVIGPKARVVSLPTKPDDFFVVYHGTPQQFQHWLREAF